jgi:hypothetical protein
VSVQATTWVWDHSKAENAGLLVMLAIADSANREGAAAMQSVPTIAKMARTSERHVARCIAKLLEMGELEKTGVSQRYGTIVYRLPGMGADPQYPATPDAEVTPDNPSTPDLGDTQPLTSVSPTPDLGDTQPQRTPQGTNPTTSSGDDGEGEDSSKASAPGVDALFNDWWNYYPKKVSKKDARTAFEKALKRTNFETIRAGLVAAIKTWRIDGRVVVEGQGKDLTVKLVGGTPEKRELAKGVPHAATWLNADRWEDEHEAATPVADTNGGTSWMHRTPDNTV